MSGDRQTALLWMAYVFTFGVTVTLQPLPEAGVCCGPNHAVLPSSFIPHQSSEHDVLKSCHITSQRLPYLTLAHVVIVPFAERIYHHGILEHTALILI